MKPPRTDWVKFLADNPAQDMVRLADEQWEGLLATLAERSVEAEQHYQDRRSDDRIRYEWRVRCVIRTQQPGARQPQTFIVYTRNISRGGIGLIHGMFVHNGTRVVVILRKRSGEGIALPGTVRWCNHLHGRLHEVGVQFEHGIDLAQFLDPDATDSPAAENPTDPS